MCNITLTLKAARVNAGLTQREAAKALKIAQSTVNSWEKGRTKVSELALRALSDLYGVPREAIILPGKSANS